MDCAALVAAARRLPCTYPNDPCDKPANKRLQDEGKMLVCESCQVRRLAEVTR